MVTDWPAAVANQSSSSGSVLPSFNIHSCVFCVPSTMVSGGRCVRSMVFVVDMTASRVSWYSKRREGSADEFDDFELLDIFLTDS
jgi:hypothetical protein